MTFNHEDKNLDAAIQWLCRAQDATGSGGVSGGYSPENGWKPPYPETTGYIIPTFLNYSKLSGNLSYRSRAIAMGDWEIGIQHPSGGVRGGIGLKDEPIVFDTGQVILGWTSLYSATGERKYLDAAVRAADWLVEIQDADGKWSKHEFLGHLHAYNTRVAWPMAKVSALSGNSKYLVAAGRNIAWVLSQTENNGWIGHMSFKPREPAFTHTVAYTLRGLYETAQFLDGKPRSEAISAVENASGRIIELHRLDRADGKAVFLPGHLNPDWKSWARYTCVTGNAQFAILFYKIHGSTEQAKYRTAADNLLASVTGTQKLDHTDEGIRGGIPGSDPPGGKYQKNSYPNWAVKFYADALMLRKSG